jgi:hypothetical protein
MAAAVAAARAGAEVCLIEARPRLGGTVTHVLIHTLGGFYDTAGQLLNEGLAGELTRALGAADAAVRRRRIGRAWVLNVCPSVYGAVVRRWIEVDPRITVFAMTRVTGIIRAAEEIAGVECSGPDGTFRLRTRAVIDATGSAAVVRLVDPSLLQSDPHRAAGGLIFRMRGLPPGALAFPHGLGVVRALRRAAEDGTLPPECSHAWMDTGVYEDEVYVKLFVPLAGDCHDKGGDWAAAAVTGSARKTQTAVVSFLSRLPSFAGAKVSATGDVGVRNGGRIRGEYCLSGSDVRQAQKFVDGACRCCWPIEYWDPEHGLSLEYLAENSYYEIPLRALKVQGIRNLWAAGKCLSADRYAQASARVVGSCWSMGEAVGKAAAAL